MDCVFCKIASGKIPADIVYHDQEIIAFRDINPQAPLHLIIIPKKHVPSLDQMKEGEAALLGRMVAVANKLAKDEGVAEKGYRLAINTGVEGGQIVPHLHVHLLGGRKLADALG